MKKFTVDNYITDDDLIDILHESCRIPLLNSSSQQIKVLDYAKINEYVKNGYFFYLDSNGQQLIAINNLTALDKLPNLDNQLAISLIKRNDFYRILEQNFQHLNSIKAKYFISFLSPLLTAKNIKYSKIITGLVIIFFFVMVKFNTTFHIINNCCYLLQNCLKIILFKRALLVADAKEFSPSQFDSSINLPIYTILVPLYQEANKLESIINSIINLNYPKDKLDVKIIIEADDYEIIEKLANLAKPFYIQVVEVPFSLPKTKPKALNYAMIYLRGKYVTVYDAEDIPHPDQLLLAVKMFQTLPEEYACLQAKLNFYNANENLLTKWFSIEYSIWFDYLLKGLSILNLPIPLGGTSNHFKVDILRKVGMWDAYNVTEDADLGIRLYLHNYKVKIMDSYTLEESPISINNWLKQRSRWIKGFIQTFLVFLAQKEAHKKLKFRQIISIYIFIAISCYSFYCLPWILLRITTVSYSVISYLWLVNSYFTFCYLYGSTFYILLNTYGRIGNFRKIDYSALLSVPFYFILHSIASYRAIWELLIKPFHWNKTIHEVNISPPNLLLSGS